MELGDVELRDVELGDVRLGDMGLGNSKIWRLGDVGLENVQGLSDVINIKSIIFGEKAPFVCWYMHKGWKK